MRKMKEDYLELLFQKSSSNIVVLIQLLLISFFIILKEILYETEFTNINGMEKLLSTLIDSGSPCWSRSKPWCGKIVIGQDGYLYAVIGDLNHDGQPKTFQTVHLLMILEVSLGSIQKMDQQPLTIHLQVVKVMLSKYYAYGVRNSFGLDWSSHW